MKKNIFYLGLAVFIFGLTACEEEILREESPLANPNSSNVYFTSTNPKSIVLPIDATKFTVQISREKTVEALTVNLNNENTSGNVFTIPASVTFDAGAATATLEIGVNDAELMKKYHLALEVAFDQTNPYTLQANYPRVELNVMKEDFAPYANGIYNCDWWWEESYERVLEFSPATKVYRIKDAWDMPGYHLTFTMAEEAIGGKKAVNVIGPVKSGKNEVVTGIVHSTYGMIYAHFVGSSYDVAAKKVTFLPITWRVAAGSFGDTPESYEITTIL